MSKFKVPQPSSVTSVPPSEKVSKKPDPATTEGAASKFKVPESTGVNVPVPHSEKQNKKPDPSQGRSRAEQDAVRAQLSQRVDQLSRMALPELQLAIVMDATGSMAPVMNATKAAISSLVAKVQKKTRLTTSVALVLYRDVSDGGAHFKVVNFSTDVSAFKATLETEPACGGGDAAEDAVGGLEVALTRLTWHPNTIKVVVWTGDAPSHGYGCSSDDYPGGLPDQWTSERLISEYAKQSTHLAFMSLGHATDDMMRALQRVPGCNIQTFEKGETDPAGVMLKAFMGTMMMSATHRSATTGTQKPAPPLAPVCFTDIAPSTECATWEYPALDLSMEDKVVLFNGILRDPSDAMLNRSTTSWNISAAHFASGGCRYARCAVKGGVRMAAKDFHERSSDNFQTHFLEVRAHFVARALAFIFASKLGMDSSSFKYTEPCIVQHKGDPRSQWFTCENFVDGEFMKWNMNTGKVQRVDHEVPNAFSHFTYLYTCGEIMVLDAQGWQDPSTGNFTLTDPALQTKDGQRTLPLNTNFGQDAMDEFLKVHKCGETCAKLKLKP